MPAGVESHRSVGLQPEHEKRQIMRFRSLGVSLKQKTDTLMDARSVVWGLRVPQMLLAHYWDYSAPVLGASPHSLDRSGMGVAH